MRERWSTIEGANISYTLYIHTYIIYICISIYRDWLTFIFVKLYSLHLQSFCLKLYVQFYMDLSFRDKVAFANRWIDRISRFLRTPIYIVLYVFMRTMHICKIFPIFVFLLLLFLFFFFVFKQITIQIHMWETVTIVCFCVCCCLVFYIEMICIIIWTT